MAEFLSDPMGATREDALQSPCPPSGGTMTHRGEAVALGRGLLERGLVVALEWAELLHLPGGPLLNGWFGVGKGEKLASGPWLGFAILRLIMNLTASNGV